LTSLPVLRYSSGLRKGRLKILSIVEISSGDQHEAAFREAIRARSGALAVTRTRLSNAYRKEIVDLAAKNHLPAIYYREEFVKAGGLMSYGADEVEPFRRAAAMIDKILKAS